MSRYTIPVMIAPMKKKKRAEGEKHVHTWIFAALDAEIVGIDFTTDMKRTLITENYGV
jgi:hypothetical protein